MEAAVVGILIGLAMVSVLAGVVAFAALGMVDGKAFSASRDHAPNGRRASIRGGRA